MGGMARRLACEAVLVHLVPECTPSNPKHPNGGRSILLMADHQTDWLNYARGVAVGQDGARWRFEQQGEPLPFEDTSAYQRRRVKDRFTEQMLLDFAAHLGLFPMDEDFYADHGVLVTTRHDADADRFAMTLAQVRAKYGLS